MSEKGLTSFPIFLIEIFYSFTMLLFNFMQTIVNIKSNQISVHNLIFSECYYQDFK